MTVRIELNPTLYEFLQIMHQLPADERAQYEAFSGEIYDPDKVAATFYLRPAVVKGSYYAGDQLLAVAGYSLVVPGTYEDWMFTSPLAFQKYALGMTRQTRLVMREMFKYGARRLQCLSLASRIEAHKWYHALGLKRGLDIPSFGANGEDAVMFYRLGDK